ncbi:hypothetical protein [Mumia zhuanghuii]|uniref:Uncharacterized protein n=1 Tax=Mumia zhuanghuii TaxID=2585211 RepID=A0A5C4MAJ3_9ACTN|nr:hypothetical protein [Mumia zhuanghuii]TNC32524.1 hypothetical protein FHE65_30360 [Mumia zhuanghuii]
MAPAQWKEVMRASALLLYKRLLDLLERRWELKRAQQAQMWALGRLPRLEWPAKSELVEFVEPQLRRCCDSMHTPGRPD